MKLLLDTHALLWLLREPHKISIAAEIAVKDEANQVLVSAASAWEIAIKARSGRLAVDEALLVGFDNTMGVLGFEVLAITSMHGVVAGGLPSPHRDPFDRMLAAQAMVEHASVVTADPAFAVLGVAVVW